MKTTDPLPAGIVALMSQIQSKERGKLSYYPTAGRPEGSNTYSRLQSWQDGKNHTGQLRSDELPALQAALDGYVRYGKLSDQYAGLMVGCARVRLDDNIENKIRL
jgi:hypothetical protein